MFGKSNNKIHPSQIVLAQEPDEYEDIRKQKLDQLNDLFNSRDENLPLTFFDLHSFENASLEEIEHELAYRILEHTYISYGRSTEFILNAENLYRMSTEQLENLNRIKAQTFLTIENLRIAWQVSTPREDNEYNDLREQVENRTAVIVLEERQQGNDFTALENINSNSEEINEATDAIINQDAAVQRVSTNISYNPASSPDLFNSSNHETPIAESDFLEVNCWGCLSKYNSHS